VNSIHQNSKGYRKKIKNKQHLNKNNEKNVHGGDVPNNHKNEKEDEKNKTIKIFVENTDIYQDKNLYNIDKTKKRNEYKSTNTNLIFHMNRGLIGGHTYTKRKPILESKKENIIQYFINTLIYD